MYKREIDGEHGNVDNIFQEHGLAGHYLEHPIPGVATLLKCTRSTHCRHENRQHDYDAIWVQVHQFTEQYGHIYIRSFSVAFGSLYFWWTKADGLCGALECCCRGLGTNRYQAFSFAIVEETIWTSRQIPWAVPPR